MRASQTASADRAGECQFQHQYQHQFLWQRGGRGTSCSQTGSSQLRWRSPPRTSMRSPACRATSGMVRSAGRACPRPSATARCRGPPRFDRQPAHDAAAGRRKRRGAWPAGVPSPAPAPDCPARRATCSRRRSARVRRAAPCGSSSTSRSAAAASRSSSAQRAARSCTPSRVSSSRPGLAVLQRLLQVFVARRRSCRACALSAASRWARRHADAGRRGLFACAPAASAPGPALHGRLARTDEAPGHQVRQRIEQEPACSAAPAGACASARLARQGEQGRQRASARYSKKNSQPAAAAPG